MEKVEETQAGVVSSTLCGVDNREVSRGQLGHLSVERQEERSPRHLTYPQVCESSPALVGWAVQCVAVVDSGHGMHLPVRGCPPGQRVLSREVDWMLEEGLALLGCGERCCPPVAPQSGAGVELRLCVRADTVMSLLSAGVGPRLGVLEFSVLEVVLEFGVLELWEELSGAQSHAKVGWPPEPSWFPLSELEKEMARVGVG